METSTKTWFAIDIRIDEQAAEAAEFALNELDAVGTEIDSLRKPTGDPQCVTGYFHVLPEMDTVHAAVDEALRIYGFTADTVKQIDGRSVVQTDWLAEWKKHWKPTTIGRFIIAPPWEMVDDASKIVIRIEPNMAFGTGTHETTKLCVKAIDDIYRPSRSVLDVGTGTGILAIAAAKLGGTRILACDTDADSVSIARENAVLNGVDDVIEFSDGSIDERTPVFDFVCANLTIDVILPMLDLLLAKAGDVLLMSGILAEQKRMITDGLGSRNVTQYMICEDGEWISVVVNVD